MKYLLSGLILFFLCLIGYQVLSPMREGLLASSMDAKSYNTDSAYRDITDHDTRISNLETQVQKNTDSISDIQAKVSQTEGFLASQTPAYSTSDEEKDIESQGNRIQSLQKRVTQNITDILSLTQKMHLVALHQYIRPDPKLTLDTTAHISDQEMIIAHEKAIAYLETVVKENIDDVTEMNNQLQKMADKHAKVIDKITGPQ
jgi:predicted  nucleic acid-binding Zn-ribbon protein